MDGILPILRKFDMHWLYKSNCHIILCGTRHDVLHQILIHVPMGISIIFVETFKSVYTSTRLTMNCLKVVH